MPQFPFAPWAYHGPKFITVGDPTSTGKMKSTGTLLPSGKVLYAGGTTTNSTTATNTACIFDPATGTFTATGNMTRARAYHSAHLLSNGKVLLIGGMASGVSSTTNTAEVFDPAGNGGVGSFSALTATMTSSRYAHTATELANGKILIAGGANAAFSVLSSAEIFDPAGNSGAGSFTATGNMVSARYYGEAVRLNSGKVLVTGGLQGSSTVIKKCEIFDPAGNSGVGTFTATADMAVNRFFHSSTLLDNGTVLVVGGAPTVSSATKSVQIFDPAGNSGAGSFTSLADLSKARGDHSATRLVDGTIFIAGGDDWVSQDYLDALLFNQFTQTFTATPISASFKHETSPAVFLGSVPNYWGGVLLIAGPNTTVKAEIFRPRV